MPWATWEGRADNKATTLQAWLAQLEGWGAKVKPTLETEDIWIGQVKWPPDGQRDWVRQRVICGRLADGSWARLAIKNYVVKV